MTTQNLSHSPLKRSWLRLAMLWLIIWLATYAFLLTRFSNAWLWLVLSGLVLAYCLWFLRRHLSQNHPAQSEILFQTLGPGNHLSLFRGLVIGLLSGFLLLPEPSWNLAWIIALSYTSASIADWVDGYVARRAGQVSVLGQHLDIEFDGLGVAVITLLAVKYGQLPWWFLGVGFARYFYLLGTWWRRRTHKTVYELPPSVHRRVMAGMFMGMMTVVLWPIVPSQMATLGGAVMAVPITLGFIRDWLFTAGYLKGQEPVYRAVQRGLYQLMGLWLPPLWRLLLAAAMILIIQAAQPWYRPQAWVHLLISWAIPLPQLLALLLSLIAVIGTLMVFFGFIGRAGAIILLFPIGFDIATRDLTWVNGLALVCTMCLSLLGTGLLSMWQPEEIFVLQRRGKKD